MTDSPGTTGTGTPVKPPCGSVTTGVTCHWPKVRWSTKLSTRAFSPTSTSAEIRTCVVGRAGSAASWISICPLIPR